MKNLSQSFAYSVGKKFIMALTGLFLVVFLIEHLIGNLLLYSGEEAFNSYAEFMGHNIFIRIAEVVLFGGFLFHIVDGLLITKENKSARPVKYAKYKGSVTGSWYSRNMAPTGIIILIFLILHLISFFALARFGVDVSLGADSSEYMEPWGKESFSLYDKVVALFRMKWYSAIYVVSMVFVGFHLNHGFQSAFQTIGWRHSKYTPIIKGIGTAFAIIVPAAFASIPVYFAFFN